jgi:predicted nuclease of predicted toxin-antitoxin system
MSVVGRSVSKQRTGEGVRLDRADDEAVWRHAQHDGFAIVTLDGDFADIASLRGAPPKIIWLRCGNQPTRAVERIIRDNAPSIVAFLEADEPVCLELY